MDTTRLEHPTRCKVATAVVALAIGAAVCLSGSPEEAHAANASTKGGVVATASHKVTTKKPSVVKVTKKKAVKKAVKAKKAAVKKATAKKTATKKTSATSKATVTANTSAKSTTSSPTVTLSAASRTSMGTSSGTTAKAATGSTSTTPTSASKPVISTTEAKIESGRYYKLKSAVGPQYLDMSASSVASKGNAQIWGDTKAPAQYWKFTEVKKGTYRITNANSELALDVDSNSTANGANVQQYAYNGSDAQLWKVYKGANGNVIVNAKTGKAIDVAGGVNKAGTNVRMWERNDSKAQSWQMSLVSYTQQTVSMKDGYYMLKSEVGPQYLDMSKSATNDGGNAQVWGYTNAPAQLWRLKNRGGGYFSLVNVNSDKALDVSANKTANGTNVQQWAYNGSGAQLWKAYRSIYGGYVFVGKTSGKALDVQAGLDKAGQNVQIWDRNETKAQSWSLASINSEVLAARAVFHAYNEYRASKGYKKVTWDNNLATEAKNNAIYQANRGTLTHIATDRKSDILQYATWFMDPLDTVNRWANSDGHRRMMQCDSADRAAVGVHFKNGRWYYVILYHFNGSCNQSGA